MFFVLFFQTSQDVAEYNVLSLLHELTHNTKYVPPKVEEEAKEEQPKGATLTGMQIVFWAESYYIWIWSNCIYSDDRGEIFMKQSVNKCRFLKSLHYIFPFL